MTNLPVPFGQIERGSNPFAPLGKLTLDLASRADALAEQGDVEALGYALHYLRDYLRQVRDLSQHIEGHVAGLMESKQINLDDFLILEKRYGKKRTKWESERLLQHLIGGDQIVNPETGENLYDLLVSVIPFTGSMSWRVTELRKRGIDPGEWADEEPGRTTVSTQANEGNN